VKEARALFGFTSGADLYFGLTGGAQRPAAQERPATGVSDDGPER
jgi:hypothetical protein